MILENKLKINSELVLARVEERLAKTNTKALFDP